MYGRLEALGEFALLEILPIAILVSSIVGVVEVRFCIRSLGMMSPGGGIQLLLSSHCHPLNRQVVLNCFAGFSTFSSSNALLLLGGRIAVGAQS